MLKPVTLSSQNRTIQTNIKHYLEKSDCQKENSLDDVMGVSNLKEHAGLHRLWFTTVRSHSCFSCIILPPKPLFFPSPNSTVSHITLFPSQSPVSNMEVAAQATKQPRRVWDLSCQGKADTGTGPVVAGVCVHNPWVAKADLTKKWDSKEGNKRFSAQRLAERVGLGKGVYLVSRDGCSAWHDAGELTQLLSALDPMQLLPGCGFAVVWETFQEQNGMRKSTQRSFKKLVSSSLPLCENSFHPVGLKKFAHIWEK